MRIHIVQKGDTLWNISQKYGVNFEELKAVNTQLADPNMIMPGMKIKVPQASKQVKKEAHMKKETYVKKEAQKAVPPYKDTSPKPIPVIKEDEKAPAPKGVMEKPLMPMQPIHMNMQMPSIDQQMQNYYTTFHLPQMPMPQAKEQEVESEESPVVAPQAYMPVQQPCPPMQPQLVHTDYYCCPPQPMGVLPAQMPMQPMPYHHQPGGCNPVMPAQDYGMESSSMEYATQAGGDCGCGEGSSQWQPYPHMQGSPMMYHGQQPTAVSPYQQGWNQMPYQAQPYGGWFQGGMMPMQGMPAQGGMTPMQGMPAQGGMTPMQGMPAQGMYNQGWGEANLPQGQPWTPGPWRDDDIDDE